MSEIEQASFHRKQAMLAFMAAIQAATESEKAAHLAQLETHRRALKELAGQEEQGSAEKNSIWL
jgi:hypothetical protein